MESLAAVGSACLTAAYGLALIRKNATAIPLGWIVVFLLGLAVLLNGLIPLQLIAWLLALGFALLVQRRKRLFT